jgi:hypothetical protein
MLITTKMSSEKYINSTYSLSENILRLDFINSNTYFMLHLGQKKNVCLRSPDPYMPTLPIYAVVYRIFKSSTAYRL